MTQPEQYEVTLTSTDVINMLQILEVCMSRGAFKAQEAAAVGSIFTRLSSVLSKDEQETVILTEE